MNFSFRNNTIIITTALYILGLILRLIPTILNGFLFDEAAYFFVSKDSTFLDLFRGEMPTHPFLWLFFIKLMGHINTSPVFLRLPSVFAGSLSILLVYIISTKIKASKLFLLVTTFLFATSAFQIDQSWQATMYSVEICFMLISLLVLITYLKNELPVYAHMLTGLLIVTIFIDYSGVWLLASLHIALAVWFLLIKRVNKTLLVSLLCVDAFLFAYLPIILTNLSRAMEQTFWIPKPSWESVVSMLSYFYGVGDGVPAPLFQIVLGLFLLTSVSFCVISLFISGSRKSPQYFFTLWLMSVLLFTTTTSLIASNILPNSVFLPRHLVALSIFPIFSLAMMIDWMCQQKSRIIQVCGLVLFFVLLFMNANFYINDIGGHKHDRHIGPSYKEAALFIRDQANLKTDLLVFRRVGDGRIFDYYFGGYFNNTYSSNNPSYRVALLADITNNRVPQSFEPYNIWYITTGKFSTISKSLPCSFMAGQTIIKAITISRCAGENKY